MNDDGFFESGTRLGYGEPVDLYEDDKCATDLGEWTARVGRFMTERAIARHALCDQIEQGLPFIDDLPS